MQFVVVPNVVPKKMVDAAKRRINQCIGMARRAAMGYQDLGADRHLVTDRAALLDRAGETLEELGSEPAVTDLFNSSGAIQLLESVLGDGAVEPQAAGQIQVLFPPTEDLTQAVGQMGWKNEDVPWYGWGGHLDGQSNGGVNGNAKEMDNNCNIKNFTTLVGFPLSDQMEEGVGNLGVLRTAHHAMESVFRHQHAKGGPLGPDGPDWPREEPRQGRNSYAPAVRDAFRTNADGEEAIVSANGRAWPKPHFVKTKPGDCVIVKHETPHSGTRIDGPDPRYMIYFRVIHAKRPAGFELCYPDAMTNIWLEWPGMAEVVSRHQQEQASVPGTARKSKL